jgi:hypothetical protein
MRMKVRKNLLLNLQAVEAGEKLVKAGAAASLSELVEKQLQGAGVGEDEHFSSHHGKPAPRKGDARFNYLTRKHRGMR